MDAPSQRRSIRATPALLKDLRSLRVVVFHPDDTDGQSLSQQLQRIGCKVEMFWPPLPALPESIDVIFLAVRPESMEANYEWLRTAAVPAIIAIVTYENPTIVESVLRIGACAVLPSPVRSFGLLSALVVARHVHNLIGDQSRKVRRLEAKLLGAREVENAKAVIRRVHGVSDAAAYEYIREQAMKKRVTVEEIATAIVGADKILSSGAP